MPAANQFAAFLKSFLYAVRGLKACLSERNMRFHLSAAVFVTAFSLVYRLERAQFGLLFFAIGLVISLEAVNTAVEHLTDLVSPGFHPIAGKVKDIAAGAVLVGAVTAAVIGCVLFLQFPRLTDTLLLIVTSWRLPVFAVLIVGSVWFTFFYHPRR